MSSLFAVLTALHAQASTQTEDLTQREDVSAFIERVSTANKLDAEKLRTVLAAARVQQSILEAIARPAHIGPEGLGENSLARADMRWSLAQLTLPHPLVRIIVLEQLYRAWTINTGHPYHR